MKPLNKFLFHVVCFIAAIAGLDFWTGRGPLELIDLIGGTNLSDSYVTWYEYQLIELTWWAHQHTYSLATTAVLIAFLVWFAWKPFWFWRHRRVAVIFWMLGNGLWVVDGSGKRQPLPWVPILKIRGGRLVVGGLWFWVRSVHTTVATLAATHSDLENASNLTLTAQPETVTADVVVWRGQ